MSKRYEVEGEWTSVLSETIVDPWEDGARADLDVSLADVRDTRTGDRFRDGASGSR